MTYPVIKVEMIDIVSAYGIGRVSTFCTGLLKKQSIIIIYLL